MRVAAFSAAISTALFASVDVANAVTACADCPTDKTCILQDLSYTAATPSTTIPIKFCNFNKDTKYTLKFALGTPLKCDPDGELLPVATSFSPNDACTKENCIVQVTLTEEIDWAITLMNNAAVNTLQAEITSSTGQTGLVQIAKLSSEASSLVMEGTGDSATKATVCTSEFGVKARQLSRLAACNVVELCLGKSGDSGCPKSLQKELTIGDVTCETGSCTGTLTTKALPCDANSADSGSLFINLKVGNSEASSYARISTLTAAGAPKITGANKVQIGSKKIVILSDATCLKESLNATVAGASAEIVENSGGDVTVSLDSAITSDDDKLAITLSQCNAPSDTYSADVNEASSDPDADTETSGTNDADDAGDTAGDGEIGQAGKTSTQTTNTTTGLPYGLYIGIAIGGLAFFGFLFECWYHKRKQRQGQHTSGPVTHDAARNAV